WLRGVRQLVDQYQKWQEFRGRLTNLDALTFRRRLRADHVSLQPLQHFPHAFLEIWRKWEARQARVFVFRQDDQSTEQASVHIGANVAVVVVEGPSSNRIFSYFERVRPRLPRAYFIRTTPVITLRTKWPRAVRIYAIAQTMEMEAMWG